MGSSTAFASIVLAVVSLTACKAGSGELCRCAEDCRDGLQCAAGPTVLDPERCFEGDKTGECIENEQLPDETGGLGPPGPLDDLPSKRDLPTGEDTGTATTETSTADESDTGTESTDTTDTDTTDTTDSTDTDSTDTTDTGTTDTGTTDTGTTSTT